jgi:glycosyltransferase involved in cell wall biosynthesis
MSRVMLVCPEPLAHRQPAGIGIRFIEMSKVLHAAGHDISLLSPNEGPISPETLRDVSERCDVAVVQGHIANDFFAHARAIPTVVDLYDPFIVENFHYYAERGTEVFAHDHATLMNSLLRGDVFLCASEAQRFFYVGMLLAVGRLNPIAFEGDPHLNSLLRIAPFGVPAPRPGTGEGARPPAVLFGGIYDWYDPILAIEAIAIARETMPSLTLTFTHHPNPDLTPQGRTAAAIEHVRGKRYDFVELVPWVAYSEREAFYDRFSAALLTFPQSIETDLSMRTRVYDYLWGGLPIVTSSAPGTDEILEKYDAGRIVRGEEPRHYANALIEVMRGNLRQNMQRFVSDHQWSRTLAPLVEFCNAPAIDKTKETFAVRLQTQAPPASILDRIKRRIGGRA